MGIMEKCTTYSSVRSSEGEARWEILHDKLNARVEKTGWRVMDNKLRQIGIPPRSVNKDYAVFYDWDVSPPKDCPNGEPRTGCCKRPESECKRKSCDKCGCCRYT